MSIHFVETFFIYNIKTKLQEELNMTLQEVCKILGKSENTLITNFNRTKENLEKKGIILIKEGIGKNANYIIQYKEDKNNGTCDSNS